MKEGKWTRSTHKGEVVHVVFLKSLVIPPRSKRRRYTNSRITSGTCPYMGGRMSQNISDVFMTFISFSDVPRTRTGLIVK